MATDTGQYGLMSEVENDSFGLKLVGNERLRRNWKSLDTHYKPWLSLYQEVQEYIAPGRGRFPEKEGTPNQRTTISNRLINPVAADAVSVLGAGLQGGLSSPARPWFQLTFEDDGLNKYGPAKNWLDECEKALYAIFKKSNFYSIVHNVYEEIGAFCTGCMMVNPDAENVVSFDYLTAGDYRFAVGSNGRTHSLYRKIRMQLHQMARDFGYENLTDKTKRMLERNPYDWRDVLHCIEPNGQYDDTQGEPFGANKPYQSTFIEFNEPEHVLYQGGTYEMPVMTPRWISRSGEAYGFGPGILSLPLTKSIQRMERLAMLAEEKYINPPLGVAAAFKDRMTDLSPGAKIPIRDTDDVRKAIQKLVDIDPQAITIFEEKVSKTEERIRRLFFYDLFLMVSMQDKQMTATEVASRNEEKMVLIGPTVTGQNYELLDPAIHRVFAIAARAQKLPPPPQEILEMGDMAQYKVEYVSILAQAQKLVNAQGMNAYLATAERIAAFNPESMDRTDWDQYLQEYADMVNISGKIVRDDDAVQGIREARQQAAAEQQAMAQQDLNASTIQKMGGAKVGGGTMLDEFANSIGATDGNA